MTYWLSGVAGYLRLSKMPSPIPIENLYYLFCYAWGHFREGKALAVGATNSPEIANLFARVLINGVKHLLRRGLDRGYVSLEEDLRNIRGRIALGPSIKRTLLKNGMAHCIFDELSHDVLHNRIIKSTIQSLKHTDKLDAAIRGQLYELDRHLAGISHIRLHKNDFRRVQLSRNNSFYNLLLNICELIHDCLLPTEDAGRFRFNDISKDEVRMSGVFEEFVRKFYYLEQSDYSVRRNNIAWSVSHMTDADAAYLPVMKTDICLKSNKRTIIVDTKFYTKTFNSNFGSRKIQSSDLYQLYAYLRNAEVKLEDNQALAGMLLYPTTDEDVVLNYVFSKHPVRVATVDLSASWPEIHTRLLNLLFESEPPEVAQIH